MLKSIKDINHPDCKKNLDKFIETINRLIKEGYVLQNGKIIKDGQIAEPPEWLKQNK
jgi:hypothetical protein